MITNARNPRWTDSTRKTIIVDVEMDGDWVGFTASPEDCTTHGPMLFNFAVNGLFGEVAPSDEERIIAGELPIPEGYAVQEGKLVNIAVYEQMAMEELNRRLAELNSEEAKAKAEIDEDYAAERKAKLTALLAVKQQPSWPVTVEWPGVL
jgi:hypothetical protein